MGLDVSPRPVSLCALFFGCNQLLTAWFACETRSRKGERTVLFCSSSSSSTGTELNQRTPLGFFPSPSPSLVLLVIRKREEKNQGFVKRKSTERKRMQEEVKQGWGVAVVHMDFSPFFLPPPHSPLYLSHLFLSLSLPPFLVLLSLPLLCSWHWPDMLQQHSSLAH